MSSKPKRPTLRPGWVIYGRTSDEDAQAPERSLGSQRRLCMEQLIAGSDLELLKEYDDIFSGRATDRKHYQELLAAARNGEFSHVAIAFVDRFGRNDVEGIRAFDELNKLGIKVRIATYPSLDPATPDGRMVVTMLFGVARFESDRNSQRTREGMHTKLLGGDWAWKAPDGYLNRELRTTEVAREERLKHARYKRWIELDRAQGQVWRMAWDLLLRDEYTLEQICTELHARGYCLRSGSSFIEVRKDGTRAANVKAVSRVFHNWFYAGWVVIDTDWAKIPPKTVRGNWTPIVSTEEFEAGLALLDKRNRDRSHQRKNYYLLQGLIYLQKDADTLIKLVCSKPNAGRRGGGNPYYCIPSSSTNFLCSSVDKQIAAWLHNLQVDDKYLPAIREAYVSELDGRIGRPHTDERAAMEKTLKDLAEEELRCARLHAKRQLTDETWESLWREWQDQRSAIKATLEAMNRKTETHIATLDDALRLIGKAGILFDRLPLKGQKDLMRHVVKRVVINPEGQVLRMELRPPFSYLHQLSAKVGGQPVSGARGKQTSSPQAASSSYLTLGVGIYAPHADQFLTESSPVGTDFLANLQGEGEASTAEASAAGIRVVHLRIPMVLGGEAIRRRMGRLGSGRQWSSWIGRDELASIIQFVLVNDTLAGPVNPTSPNPVQNAELAEALARVHGGRGGIPMPAFLLRVLFGEMAEALILASRRTIPRKLLDAGYQFRFADLETALRHEIAAA